MPRPSPARPSAAADHRLKSRPGSPWGEPLEARRLMSVNVTTYHYDNARDGANTHETALTTANVNSKSFGKVASLAVDGQVYAQPLVMTGVAVPGQGTHDLVLVATEADSVYAFDAAGNDPAQGYLWRTSLLEPGETAVPQSDYGTTDITALIGVTGTPVIDPKTGTLYVVGAFKAADGTYSQRLYALNVATGAVKLGGPVTISASVAGTGTGSVDGQVVFNAYRENQRPALTLANGQVYVAWASHGDEDPWHGWVMGYDAATLEQRDVYNDSPDGDAGGVWMSGGGIAVDAAGNLYFTNGNGTFDADTGGPDLSMAVEKLSPTLGVEDYFSPSNEASLSDDDLDYGCSDVILLTGQTGGDPNQILTESKWGTMYLNDGDTGHLGEFNADGNDDLSEVNITPDADTSNLHNTISYWDGHAYVGGDVLPLQSFSVGGGTLGQTPSSVTAHVFGDGAQEDGQGTGPTISSNGTKDGIVWALDNSGFTSGPAVLYAYDATDLGHELYDSTQAANGRDTAGGAVKFQTPVVANGRVYVAGAGVVTIYGLISPSTAAPKITAAAAAHPATVTGTTTALSVTAADPAADLRPTYTWAATAVPAGAPAPTFSTDGTNTSNDPTVTFGQAGRYTFTVTANDPNSQKTATSTVTVTVRQTTTGVTVSPSAVSLPDRGTEQFSAQATDQFGSPTASQPKFTWAVKPGGAGGTVTSAGLYTAPTHGGGTDTVTATTGAGTAAATVTITVPSATVQVDLSGLFTKVGIVTDGRAFPVGVGIDDGGSGLSSTLLAGTQTWDGSPFALGPTTLFDRAPNVVGGAGQAIPLAPQARYATLKLLALHVDGDGDDLPLTVTYTDGTTQTFTQSFSDWYTPEGFAGESVAVAMPYRDLSDGSEDDRPFNVYGYSFALNSAKTVQSLTLPADADLDVLAVDLAGTALTVPAASTPGVVTGTTTGLSVTAVDPAPDAAPTYRWAATTVPAGARTPTFAANGTAAAGSTTATFSAAGAYTFTVTVTDPATGQTTTSSVAVTVTPTVHGLTVTPAGAATLADGQTRQFAAAAVDQFGRPITTPPGVAWSLVSPGVGSVNSAGLYRAPSSGTGTAVVQATADGYTARSGTITVASRPAAKLTGTLLGTAGSYRNDGNTIAKAVDGDLGTFFDSAAADGSWVGYDLGTAATVASVAFAPRPGFSGRMVGGVFQGSNSPTFSTGVTDLYTVTAPPKAGVLTSVPITDAAAFRYVRYLSPQRSYGNVAEVDFFGPAGS